VWKHTSVRNVIILCIGLANRARKWSVLAVNRQFVRKHPKIARDKSAPD